MAARDPRPLRVLICTADGRLLDLGAGGKESGTAEFAALLRAGERVRVRHETTGRDCTVELLLEVVSAQVPTEGVLSGLSGLPGLPGLPGLSVLSGLLGARPDAGRTP